jgi:hypothetical protein
MVKDADIQRYESVKREKEDLEAEVKKKEELKDSGVKTFITEKQSFIEDLEK